jgi:excisionase family DNA binding protein
VSAARAAHVSLSGAFGRYIVMAAKSRKQLTNLDSYASPFITVRQLSEYWNVSRKHVLKLIQTGRLESIRFGPKTYRIPVQAARAFERRNGSRDVSGIKR